MNKKLVLFFLFMSIIGVIILFFAFNTQIRKLYCEMQPTSTLFFPGTSNPKESCFWNLALDKKNPEFCEKTHYLCYEKFGLSAYIFESCFKDNQKCMTFLNFKEICEKATTEIGKEYCYKKYEEIKGIARNGLK